MTKSKKSKPVLLVATTTFPRWQNDTDPPFVYELAKRLVSDFEVIVHTPHYPGAEFKEDLAGLYVHRFRYFFERYEKIAGQTAILPFLRKNRRYYLILPFFLIFQFISLLFLIKKNRPDVIHAHWLVPTGFFAICIRLFGLKIPVVITCHGADVFGLQLSFFKRVKKSVIKRAQKVVVVSNALKEELIKLGANAKGIDIVPMGVDSQLFNPSRYSDLLRKELNIDGKILLYVGRLTPKKGVRYLIEAFKIVCNRGYKATLIIVGDGEERKLLESQVSVLGLEDRIKFLGAVPNTRLPIYYATSDIFIGPSVATEDGDSEGFGLTFVEAAMSGCFLIGAKTGGIVDIIEDGITGLLTEPGNSLDLAEKIIWAITNPQNANFQKEFSLERSITKYDWKVIVRKYLSIMNDVTSFHKSGLI